MPDNDAGPNGLSLDQWESLSGFPIPSEVPVAADPVPPPAPPVVEDAPPAEEIVPAEPVVPDAPAVPEP